MINKKRTITTFLDLVRIDSPSGEEETVRKELANRLKKLGSKVEMDSYGNLIAHIDGKGESFLLNAHMDTVEPGRGIKPVVDGDIIKTDGSTILGGDPKAGVTAILEALASAKEDGKAVRALDIVFTIGEETGLHGAMNLDYTKVRAKQGVTFDGERSVECVDIAAPGYHRIDAKIIGRSAHAGAVPEKGISSIKIASEIISQLGLGRIDKETTANIGLITGGSARNAIPELVHFQGEIRSLDKQKLAKHTKHFEDVFNKVQGRYSEAVVEMLIEKECDPYNFSLDTPLLQYLKKIYKKLGMHPNFKQTGGASDVNILTAHGITIVDVGTGGEELHTTREYVRIS